MSRDALVIGINTYERLSNLKSPSEDAEAIAQRLSQHGNFKVRRLPAVKREGTICVGQKTKVTLSQLEEALVQLFKPEGDNSPETALLYFSGHGQRKNRGIQEGFLATSDVNPDLGLYGLSLQWLRRLLQESPIRQQIIWLDCCYSGELLNFAEADPGDRGKGRDRCFIAASREFEVAYEAIGGNYSVLTESLLQGLDPKRQPDGLVTNYTLIEHLNQALKSATQRPLYANSGGQIILTGTAAESKNPVLGGICPYKGLAYFDCNNEDPKYFYGRTALTDQLLEKVRSGNFLAILGASGSGKSSLVRAGLIHQIKLGHRLSGSDRWLIYIFRPGEHPLQQLAEVFVEPELSDIERATQLAKAQDLITTGAIGLSHLVTATGSDRVILVVDQFEEVFTICQDSTERQQFFECILGGINATDASTKDKLSVANPNKSLTAKLCLILTMRADFFGKCTEQDYAGLASLIQEHLVTVTPMNQEELEQAITEPAKQVGLEIERELVTEMILDVEGSPGSLPLLQYTLTELWNQRIVERLTLSTYTRLGGVKGTLQKRATEVYQSFSPEEQRAAKRIFLELTQLGEGTEDTRRQVFKQDLVTSQQSETLVDRVLQKLADAKLAVTSTLTEKGSKSGQVAVVDVAHEALIRHWSLLRQWVNENRDTLRKKRTIEADAQEWFEKGKSNDYLLRGSPLAEAESFFAHYSESVPLSSLGREFVQKSIQQQRNNRLRTISIVASAIAILTGTSVLATGKWIEAERGRINAQLDALTFSAEALFTSHLELEALLQSLKVAQQQKRERWVSADTKIQVVTALWKQVYGVQEHNRLEGHTDVVTSVAWSPDGKMLASASDNTIKLWSSDGKELKTLQGHQEKVLSVGWSPDGKTLASVSEDNTIKLWSSNGKELKTLTNDYDFTSISFSPDGKTLTSGDTWGIIKLWSLDGNELKTLKGHRNSVRSLAWSPDGQTLASGDTWGIIKLWNLDGNEIKTLPGHESLVWSLSFSPDGQTLASASQDKTIKLWGLDGHERRTLVGHTDSVYSVAWSPNDQTLASAGVEGIKLWGDFGSHEMATLKGHSAWVTSVSFSPDGNTIASASADGTIKLWRNNSNQLTMLSDGQFNGVFDVSFSPDGQTIASLNSNHSLKLWRKDSKELTSFLPTTEVTSGFSGFSFSPDGTMLASANSHGTIQLWNLDGQKIRTIGKPTEEDRGIVVRTVAWSPDGKMLTSANIEDNIITIWSVEGKEISTLKGHGDVVTSVAWSPNGQMIASASTDKTIKIWSLEGKEIATFKGHTAAVHSIAWSPNGQMLASASADKTIKLWSLSGKEIRTLKGHSDKVYHVNVSPDGQILTSASADATIKLWSLDGKNLATLNDGQVSSVTWSPDGKILAAGGSAIFLWNLDLDDLMVRGCDWVHDYLHNPNAKISDEERHLCDGIGISGS